MVRQKAGLNRSILNQGWHIGRVLLARTEYAIERLKVADVLTVLLEAVFLFNSEH